MAPAPQADRIFSCRAISALLASATKSLLKTITFRVGKETFDRPQATFGNANFGKITAMAETTLHGRFNLL
jgi:hypothetical protein